MKIMTICFVLENETNNSKLYFSLYNIQALSTLMNTIFVIIENHNIKRLVFLPTCSTCFNEYTKVYFGQYCIMRLFYIISTSVTILMYEHRCLTRTL